MSCKYYFLPKQPKMLNNNTRPSPKPICIIPKFEKSLLEFSASHSFRINKQFHSDPGINLHIGEWDECWYRYLLAQIFDIFWNIQRLTRPRPVHPLLQYDICDNKASRTSFATSRSFKSRMKRMSNSATHLFARLQLITSLHFNNF